MPRIITYDLIPDKITFDEPIPVMAGGNQIKRKINNHSVVRQSVRVPIRYELEKGTKTDLTLAPKGCKFYSFGVREDVFNDSELGTYSMCLCINFNPGEESKEQDFCLDIYNIYNTCKKYLLENRKEFNIKATNEEDIEEYF